MRNEYAGKNWARMRTHKTPLGFIALLVISLGSASANAESFGIDSSKMQNGPVTCDGVGCHVSASSEVFVTISGPAALNLGESAVYTVEMFENVQGGLQVGAGVNVSAFVDGVLTDLAQGILSENDNASQITSLPFLPATGQVTHFAATFNSVDKFFYDFTVMAPNQPGILELRGAMNSFDDSGTELGEKWNNTSLFVTVPEPSVPLLVLAGVATLSMLDRRRRSLGD